MSINEMAIALARHEKALQDKARLTKAISLELAKCASIAAFEKAYDSPMYKDSDWHDAKGNFKNHIWEAYTFRDHFGGCKTTLSRGEFAGFLRETGCAGCIRAWDLIQERSAVLAALGNARRSIRAHGKRALESARSEIDSARQSALEDWIASNRPSGDADQVGRLWERSAEFRDTEDGIAATYKGLGE